MSVLGAGVVLVLFAALTAAAAGAGDEPSRLPGETCANAIPLPELPCSVSGSTMGYTNEYDEICPYGESNSPDVVYSITPPYDTYVIITLCIGETDYDSKIFMYEDACTMGAPYACNDDACSSPAYDDYVSRLPCVFLTAGHTYFIVIDGYGSAAGNYQMDIFPPVPPAPCPPGATPEPEPCGQSLNAGCGADPPAFSPASLNETICGTLWSTPDDWDTDWYQVELTAATQLQWTVSADIAFTVLALRPGAPGSECADMQVLSWAAGGGPCEVVTLDTPCLEPGTYWLWIGPEAYDYRPCPQEYVVTLTALTCEDPLGACCHPDGSCDLLIQSACGDEWLGGFTTCDQCNCLPPPPSGVVEEPEPCGQSTNAGCYSTPVGFSPIECGQTVHGTAWGLNGDSDLDWYEVVVDEPQLFVWEVVADFPVIVVVIEAGHGADPCDDFATLYGAGGDACEPVRVATECLWTGTYWFLVMPAEWEDLPCPRQYLATLYCWPCNPPSGACCLDDGTCLVTTALQCRGEYQGDGTTCDPSPCPPPVCDGDCNCDASVGFADIDLFVAGIPNNEANWAAKYELYYGVAPPAGCWANTDVNGIGTHCGFDDIDSFVKLIPTQCTPRACCFPDHTCQDLVPGQCLIAGGTFFTGPAGNRPCAETTCP